MYWYLPEPYIRLWHLEVLGLTFRQLHRKFELSLKTQCGQLKSTQDA